MQIFKKSNAFKCKLLTHELFLYVNFTNAVLIRKSIQYFISNHFINQNFINQNIEQHVWGWYDLQRHDAAMVNESPKTHSLVTAFAARMYRQWMLAVTPTKGRHLDQIITLSNVFSSLPKFTKSDQNGALEMESDKRSSSCTMNSNI